MLLKRKRRKRKLTQNKCYKIEGDKLIRTRKTCPRCGDAVFLAKHKNRLSCGKCGYTEFIRS
ncbi:MAG TPA: 30S ribosomal protein S27ae [Thermoplasmata archaeon]|nr:30S ribosomal protein S27ae [Thermoplasmata archaeon]